METLGRRAAYLAAFCSSLAILTITALVGLIFVDSATASVGGVSPHANRSSTPPETEPVAEEAPVTTAALVNGRAITPIDAPPAVKKVIAAANKIRAKPYVWGGGHGRWWDSGYDCSGAVSFALHGGKLLESPLPSGSMMSWEKAGLGRWITVFANSGHAYAVIAGLRWDTSMTGGNGPRWSAEMRSSRGFVARHPASY